MNIGKLFTIFSQLAEKIVIIREGYAGEIHPEILRIALAVLIAVQNRIDVIEKLLRLELLPLFCETIQELLGNIVFPLFAGKDVFFVVFRVKIEGEDIRNLACFYSIYSSFLIMHLILLHVARFHLSLPAAQR